MPLLKLLAVVGLFIAGAVQAEPKAPLSWEEIKEKYKVDQAIKETIRERRHIARGQLIVIDTRDQVACRKVFDSMARLPELNGPRITVDQFCRRDPESPFISVAVMQDITEHVTPIDIDVLRSTDKNLTNDTRNLAYSMGVAMGILWLMPESVTKWNKDEIRNSDRGIFNQYADNVRRGPVVDKDDWAVNYIGHPLSGAAYYMVARTNGLSKWQSFGYSVVMSTFFWEYGIEALAEIPSIQDLILTPTIGALIGEAAYNMEQTIKANDGKLWGSERAGRVALVVLNPMGSISDGINKALGSKVIQNAEAEVVTSRRSPGSSGPGTQWSVGPMVESTYVGIRLRFKF